jgi:hypothetical protein
MWIVVAIGFVAAFIALIATVLLFTQLREHRRDLTSRESGFAGESLFWQFDLMNPDNYTPKGHLVLRRFVRALGLFAALMVALLYLAFL